jgi:hypothetical protein
VLSDLREKFHSSPGPYGFVIADSEGWRFEIFKYNERPDGTHRLPHQNLMSRTGVPLWAV